MTGLAVAAALGVLLLLGHAVVAFVSPTLRLSWYERWGVAWLLGTATGGFLWFVLSPLYRWVSPLWLLTVIAMAFGALALTRQRVAPDYAEAGSPAGADLDKVSVVLGTVLVVQAAALLGAAMLTPLGWDGLFNFELKARMAFEHDPRGQLPLAYFSDLSRVWSHASYPMLVPFSEFWIYSWVGQVNQSAVKILFPLFYLSLIAVVCGTVRRVSGTRAALLVGVALGTLPPLTLRNGAASGYADVPLAAAIAAAVCFTYMALRVNDARSMLLPAALSAAAAWTKAEGLMLAVVIGLAGFAAQPGRRAATLLWLPLVVIAPWLALQHLYGASQGGDFHAVTATTFVGNLHRIPTIAAGVARELVRPGHWALIWPAFAVTLASAMTTGRLTRAESFLAGVVVVPLALYCGVYLFSAWPSVREHMGWSLVRVLVPLAPVALVFVSIRLSDPLSETGQRWA